MFETIPPPTVIFRTAANKACRALKFISSNVSTLSFIRDSFVGVGVGVVFDVDVAVEEEEEDNEICCEALCVLCVCCCWCAVYC